MIWSSLVTWINGNLKEKLLKSAKLSKRHIGQPTLPLRQYFQPIVNSKRSTDSVRIFGTGRGERHYTESCSAADRGDSTWRSPIVNG